MSDSSGDGWGPESRYGHEVDGELEGAEEDYPPPANDVLAEPPRPPAPPPEQYGPPPGYGPPPQAGFGPPPEQYGPPPGYGPPAGQPWAPGQPFVIPVVGKGLGAKLGAKAGGDRTLVVAPDGLTHSSRNDHWQLGWSELGVLVITTAYHQNTLQAFSKKIWRIRLVFEPADPTFLQRHPGFVKAQGRFGGTGENSFGVPLGPVENIVGDLAHAFETYAGTVFRGVIEEGQVLGFGYL